MQEKDKDKWQGGKISNRCVEKEQEVRYPKEKDKSPSKDFGREKIRNDI